MYPHTLKCTGKRIQELWLTEWTRFDNVIFPRKGQEVDDIDTRTDAHDGNRPIPKSLSCNNFPGMPPTYQRNKKRKKGTDTVNQTNETEIQTEDKIRIDKIKKGQKRNNA